MRSCSLRAMFLPSMWKNAKPARLAGDCTDFGSMPPGTNQTPPLLASSTSCSAVSAMSSSSFQDVAEAVVVVVGVVEIAAASRHDTPRAAGPLAGSLHRVLAVVAALLPRERALAVHEDRAVARVRIRSSLADEGDGLARLGRKLREPHVDHGCGRRRGRFLRRGRHGEPREGGAREEGARDHAAACTRARLAATFSSKRRASITWRSWVPSETRSMPSLALTVKTSLRDSTDA